MPLPRFTPSRRSVLLGGLGAAAALGLSARPARASAADRRFIFVRVFGGWDPTRVFAADSMSNPAVAYERDAAVRTRGELRTVEHPDRPSVRQFFDENAHQAVILNGVIVPSVNHRACEHIAYTGANVETAAEWPTLIADAARDRFSLPHVIVSGRAMPGLLGRSSVLLGDDGQVGRLLDGSLMEGAGSPTGLLRPDVAALVEAQVLGRADARGRSGASAADRALADAMAGSLRKAALMRELGDTVRWNTDGSFASQVALAADLLSLGLSRCATLSFERLTWDSHEGNDDKQSANFEDLFAALRALAQTLAETPGYAAPTLADEVLVVVLSEMGRTPNENSSKGKDHWAHGSALLFGPGISGGRTIGGFSDLFYGLAVDPDSGELDPGGRELTPAVVGSTLLALADVGPVESLPEYAPILGVLA